ncbi:hypothetical protein AB4Z27_27855 [Cupriavidus sp. KB_39]|uniref:hypothetical protein n=1 Tax=Cupriavidus sp. KB_39 TaxID=3233036 RepID=UPI003F934103
MATEVTEVKCKPRLRGLQYAKISAERFPPGADRDEQGGVKAESTFEVGEVEETKLTVIGTVKIIGTRGADKEFAVLLKARSQFDVPEGTTTEDCLKPDIFPFISAQIGPLLVTEARYQLGRLGIRNLVLPFFNPFSGDITTPNSNED